MDLDGRRRLSTTGARIQSERRAVDVVVNVVVAVAVADEDDSGHGHGHGHDYGHDLLRISRDLGSSP